MLPHVGSMVDQALLHPNNRSNSVNVCTRLLRLTITGHCVIQGGGHMGSWVSNSRNVDWRSAVSR